MCNLCVPPEGNCTNFALELLQLPAIYPPRCPAGSKYLLIGRSPHLPREMPITANSGVDACPILYTTSGYWTWAGTQVSSPLGGWGGAKTPPRRRRRRR